MKSNKYITTDGKLVRKENTIYFIDKNGKRTPIPVEKIYAIYSYGSLSYTSKVVELLAKYNVPIHYFNRNGWYVGSFYPKGERFSGNVVVHQSSHYLDKYKRNHLAKKFVEGSAKNIHRNLSRYKVDFPIDDIMKRLDNSSNITDIMSVEALMRNEYYGNFDKIINNFQFEKRSRRPPHNEINALISFGNSLLYATVITEIFNTYLHPTISYLHEPSDRRFSLALDIADVFKPLLVDRVIFNLINRKIIREDHFEKDLNFCLLNDEGRKLFLSYYKKQLENTIKHRKLGRNVSYQRLIRLECYKLQKHILGMEKYEPFIIWW
ncbi:type I-B CRISPR-associated endonuclease Cas1b [Methanothermococcus sp. Ax23]|uniref:type I-B CRISPR-associated endonuclease Cas1b n=1 Tax=Methanothermococcus sp. Ax23 TaxID=3156486 RepID=UPI003BA05A56